MELKSDEIKKIIPHRYPFLLIDKVTDMKPGEWVEAIKCVSANEMYFMGHFPQKQIMPGVLIIEALAQAGHRPMEDVTRCGSIRREGRLQESKEMLT